MADSAVVRVLLRSARGPIAGIESWLGHMCLFLPCDRGTCKCFVML